MSFEEKGLRHTVTAATLFRKRRGKHLLVVKPSKPKGAYNRLDNIQANACAAITVLQGWAAAGMSAEGDGTAEETLPRRVLWEAQSNIARTPMPPPWRGR